MPRSASSSTSARSSIARTPWPIRVTGSSSAARTLWAPAHSPAWTVQPRPASGDPKRLDVVAGGEVLLVAGHREADDVGVRALGRVAGHAHRLLDAEVAHRGDQDAALDAVVAAGVVDAARD